MQRILREGGVEIVETDRNDGNMSYVWDSPDEVAQRRSRVLSELSHPADAAVALHLVQAPYVVREVTEKEANFLDPEQRILSQGAVTRNPALLLSLVVGDCAAVVCHDIKRKIHGIVHAGWREVDQGMPTKLVDEMVALGSEIADLQIWISAAIRKCCYEHPSLGEGIDPAWQRHSRPIRDSLVLREAGDDDWPVRARREPNGVVIDVIGFLHERLHQAGISADAIMDSGVCTNCSGRYFSHYRDETILRQRDEGRFLVGVRRID